VNIVRRPFLWVAGVVFVFVLFWQFLFDGQFSQGYGMMDPYVRDSAEGVVEGTLSHIDKKPNSSYYFLKEVSVRLNGTDTVFTFSDFLVIVSDVPVKGSTSFSENPPVQEMLKEEPCPGNVLRVAGTVFPFSAPGNPGQFDEKAYYREQNLYYKMLAGEISVKSRETDLIRQFLFQVRDAFLKVYERGMEEKHAGMVSAMLFGSKSALDADDKLLYQANGIGHILAISGLHISILCTFFYQFLFFLRLPRLLPFLLTVFFLLGYGTMTGFGISTSRAVLMMLFAMLGREIGRSYDALTALSVSAVVTLVQKPHAILSGSFLLSYSAMLGCILIYPAVKTAFLGTKKQQREQSRTSHRKRREICANSRFPKIMAFLFSLPEKAASSFLFNISVWMATFPVVLYFFYEIPSYGIVLNLLILPLVPFLLIFSFLGGMVGIFCLPPALPFLYVAAWILDFYEMLCHFFLSLPCPVFVLGRPSVFSIAFYVAVLGALAIFFIQAYYNRERLAYRHRMALFVIFLAAVFVLCYRRPEGKLSVAMLDVGQGDGILIEDGNGRTVLVDGGSTDVPEVGKYRILPYLKYYGISCVDYLVMTHSDEDHISGQLELMEQMGTSGVTVGCCLLPMPSEGCRGENYEKVRKMALQKNIPIRYLKPGSRITSGSLELLCLHPEAGFEGDSANASSTVLSLTYGSFSMLLTGDLEKNGEEAVTALFREGKGSLPTSYDVLKVAHHGSKNSTSEAWLSYVHPKAALISSGKKNRYGHPHKELLERLQKQGSMIFQTKDSGAVQVVSDGTQFWVYGYRPSGKVCVKFSH